MRESERYTPINAGRPLDGVLFPTRRRTVGQAGWDCANYCQAIIQKAGSIARALSPIIESSPKPVPGETRRVELPPFPHMWSNPTIPIGELCPDLPEKLDLPK